MLGSTAQELHQLIYQRLVWDALILRGEDFGSAFRYWRGSRLDRSKRGCSWGSFKRGCSWEGRFVTRWVSVLEQLLLVDVEDILLGHEEARAGQVLDAGVILIVLQLQGHPLLRRSQVHALGNDEDQTQALHGRRDMYQHYRLESRWILHSQLFTLHFPPPSWVRDMVFVVDGEPGWDGIGIESAAILEGGVGREDGQLRLQIGLHRLIIFGRNLPTASALQRILYLCADVLHSAAPGSLVEELGGAWLHPSAPYAL